MLTKIKNLLVLSGVSPANAPQLIRSARELGYEGLISTETAQDAQVLKEGAGELANGFISVGGASTPEITSDMMREFVERYTKMFGEYNDESNTKVYALEYILETLKADPAGLTDVEAFKKAMDTFEVANPYMTGEAKMKYVGTTSFGQKRQVAVPLVVNVYENGEFKTLFVAEVDYAFQGEEFITYKSISYTNTGLIYIQPALNFLPFDKAGSVVKIKKSTTYNPQIDLINSSP